MARLATDSGCWEFAVRRLAFAELFRHADQVTRLADTVGQILMGGLSAGHSIAELFIEGGQLGAKVYDRQVHVTRAHFAGRFLGGENELAAQAAFLPRRIDREKSQVATAAVYLDINASGEFAAFLREQKPTLFEILARSFGIEAVSNEEEAFDLKCLVDKRYQRGQVTFFGDAKLHETILFAQRRRKPPDVKKPADLRTVVTEPKSF